MFGPNAAFASPAIGADGTIDVAASWTSSNAGMPLAPPDAFAALKAHRKQHPKDEVVFGVGDGGRMTRHMVTPARHRFARAAGLQAVGPHVLRHSFASHPAMLGVPVRILQDWMGHASVTQTEAYAKLAPGSGQSS